MGSVAEFHIYWDREVGGGRIRQRARALRQFLEDQTGYRWTIKPGGHVRKMPILMPYLDAGGELTTATRGKRKEARQGPAAQPGERTHGKISS